jgi:hypothetical protein
MITMTVAAKLAAYTKTTQPHTTSMLMHSIHCLLSQELPYGAHHCVGCTADSANSSDQWGSHNSTSCVPDYSVSNLKKLRMALTTSAAKKKVANTTTVVRTTSSDCVRIA